jgi:hypothetical protein
VLADPRVDHGVLTEEELLAHVPGDHASGGAPALVV